MLRKLYNQVVIFLQNFYKNNNNNSVICQGDSEFKNEKEGGSELNEVKQRMKALNMKQVDMILALQERGIEVQPPMLSSTLRGVYTYPKAKLILEQCLAILEEREHNDID